MRDCLGGDRRPCRSIVIKGDLDWDEDAILAVFGGESLRPRDESTHWADRDAGRHRKDGEMLLRWRLGP